MRRTGDGIRLCDGRVIPYASEEEQESAERFREVAGAQSVAMYSIDVIRYTAILTGWASIIGAVVVGIYRISGLSEATVPTIGSAIRSLSEFCTSAAWSTLFLMSIAGAGREVLEGIIPPRVSRRPGLPYQTRSTPTAARRRTQTAAW